MRWLCALVFVTCVGCNSVAETGDQPEVKEGNNVTTSAQAANWYKQYTGTVAGQPVVVQMHQYGGLYHGAYYYTSKGQILNLLPDEDSGDSLEFSEQSMTEENDWDKSGSWTVVIKNDSLTGQWSDGQRKRVYPIRLKEVHPDGSIDLDIAYLKDSAKLNERQAAYTMFASYQFLVPGRVSGYPHKAFIDSVLYTAIGCKTGEKENCLRAMADDFFSSNRDQSVDLDSVEHISHDEQLNTWVLFNSEGWLVLERFSFSYMGGAHGNFGSNFFNIDLQRGKVWQLNNVIQGDTTKLKPLLTEAARKYFKLKAGEKLSERLLMLEEPTVTSNFYITPTGLTFVYNPYEIASYAQGVISLFIPYEKLYGMLTPEFSTRMNRK